MSEPTTRQELTERLNLIESMIAEGRQTTESWGWSFLLWGLAYYVAIAWARWGNPSIAWPVTMVAAGLLTAAIASRVSGRSPETTLGRSMAAIWIALGISLFLFGLSAGLSGRGEQHVAIAVIAIMLGMANATSGLILRWKAQLGCAIVWWTTGVVSLFGTTTQSSVAFLTAIFLCQIVFGSYMMISEARGTKPGRSNGVSHA